MYDKIASWGAVCCCIAKVVETDLIRNFEILKPYVVGHLTDDPASMVEHRVFCIVRILWFEYMYSGWEHVL